MRRLAQTLGLTSTTMRNSAVEILLLAVMSAALETACAQSTSAPRLATRDEYRACRVAEQAFDRRKSRLEALIDQHNQASAQHQAEGSKYMAIFEANRPMLKHPDKIYPGQALRIPPEPAGKA